MKQIIFFGMGKLVGKSIKRDVSMRKIVLGETHGVMGILELIMRCTWLPQLLKILIPKNLP